MKASSLKLDAGSHRVKRRRALRAYVADQVRPSSRGFILAVLLLVTIAVWSYWPTIKVLTSTWRTDDDYSAGQLVPLVAGFLVWRERKAIGKCPVVPCWWVGMALLISVQTLHIFGVLYGARPSIEQYSMVLTAISLVLMVGGWQVFRSVVWILLILFLMIPLPGGIHNLISGPLQNVATTGSVFLLEAFGATVSQQGNVVMLNETIPMAVAEACSGLRMLMAFVIVAAFVAYMVRRPRWQKAVLLFSSIPVAVMCNIVRLCITGVLFMLVNADVGKKFFHDFAGLAMMPIAALLLFAELWLMDKLIVLEPGTQPEQARGHRKSDTQVSAKLAKRKR